MSRAALPNRRPHVSFPVTHREQRFVATVGFYPHGAIGEVFLSSTKPGSDVEALARDAAIIVSIGLQHGVPLQTLRHAVTRDAAASPATLVGAMLDAILENGACQF